jgi:tagatose-6-phosphate ketose/aldose isomerase
MIADKIKTFPYNRDESWFLTRNCGFTSEEIAQQSALWRILADDLAGREKEIRDFAARAGGFGKRRIILTGAGSSAFAGEAAAAMAGKEAGVRAEPVPTTDIVSSPGSFLCPDTPSLLVSFARSGNSPESRGAVEYARKTVKDLFEIAIVCDPGSKLAELSKGSGKRSVMVMPPGSCDRGFAMTSSITCMILASCALLLAENPVLYRSFIRDIRRLADAADSVWDYYVAAAERLANHGYRRLVVLGSGCLKGIAREAALKTMELSMGAVNTGWDSSMGFRHGPKAIIKEDTVTIHIISPDPLTARYDLDLLKEINSQKKGNKVIALSAEKIDIPVDENIVSGGGDYGPGADICHGVSGLVFCQLLAMFKSLSLGLSPDNPAAAGELTRVVSGVTIYDI